MFTWKFWRPFLLFPSELWWLVDLATFLPWLSPHTLNFRALPTPAFVYSSAVSRVFLCLWTALIILFFAEFVLKCMPVKGFLVDFVNLLWIRVVTDLPSTSTLDWIAVKLKRSDLIIYVRILTRSLSVTPAFFFQHFSLNSRPAKLKKSAKLKKFSLN